MHDMGAVYVCIQSSVIMCGSQMRRQPAGHHSIVAPGSAVSSSASRPSSTTAVALWAPFAMLLLRRGSGSGTGSGSGVFS